MDELREGQGGQGMPADAPLVEEPEFYVEPPRMTRRDTWGVVAALVALAVIGWAGYVWLNPELGWSDFAARPSQRAGSAAPEVAAPSAAPAGVEVAAERTRCPYCGMFTDISLTEITAALGDGTHSHFDSWDCVFMHVQQEDTTLLSAKVRDFAEPDEARWLEAQQAWFLYDTAELEGSMPPYVAAFATEAQARQAQAELGGELLDFAGLQDKWQ